MKEKKTWKKRVLSIVLAFAMVLTQFGVWNAGKESVQAAENDSFTLYYYTESGANSAYAIKDGKVYEDLTEAGLSIKVQDQGETNSSEVTSDGYTLKLTADKTEVTVGDTITFTASLQKDGQEITDLTAAGYHF